MTPFVIHESLVRLILLSARSEPEFVSEYLQRVTNQSRIEEKSFHNIIAYSGILSQTLPKQLVDISLAFLLKELPEDRISRDIRRQKANSEWRKSLLAKPEDERTERERLELELSFPTLFADHLGSHVGGAAFAGAARWGNAPVKNHQRRNPVVPAGDISAQKAPLRVPHQANGASIAAIREDRRDHIADHQRPGRYPFGKICAVLFNSFRAGHILPVVVRQ